MDGFGTGAKALPLTAAGQMLGTRQGNDRVKSRLTNASTSFGIGQRVTRSEDPKLVRGEGVYTDDINLAGQLYAVFVRSTHAHATIVSIDLEEAKATRGVRLILTGDDLAKANYGQLTSRMPLKSRDGSPMRAPGHVGLASGKVRFVGDPIVCVVADSALAAQDAAEAVRLELDPLPAVVDARTAIAAAAPLLYEEVPDNVALDYHSGDAAAVAAAFAEAAHVTRLDIVSNRVIVNAMEPRAALADYDPHAERFTLHVGCQGVFGMRNTLANDILKVPPAKIRVLTGQVGGSFGMKSSVFPEYICLLHAARLLACPVKWTDRRSESFVSDHHGRDHEFQAELALDRRGRFLALRLTGFGNVGAYLTPFGPFMPTIGVGRNAASVYRTPLIEVNSRIVFTNTTPVGAYRGAGRPEGNYIMERLIETAAAQMGIDSVDLRRRNHIQPQDLPYLAASGMTYDSGEFTRLLEHALELADWNGFETRRRDSARRGLLRGRGIGQYLEVTAPPTREMAGLHFEADGTVTIVTGTLDYGQGHATAFAQVLVDQLGLPFSAIRLVQGDSDRLIAGGGTGGSKSLMASGQAIVEASALVVEKGLTVAAGLLEAGREDIRFEGGAFCIVGTDRSLPLSEIARLVAEGAVPGHPRGSLDVDHIHEASPAAFPNGCHVAEVEIDPQTGLVRVVRYAMANDFGTLVNPLLVEGQLHGGVVQGIGQALFESTCYDSEGQLASGSYMDYALPRAGDLPDFVFSSRPVPATTNALGVKGCGEAGCAGALPAVMNAVVDALAPYGIRHIDMPAVPARVFRAIRAAAAAHPVAGAIA
jgi:carbon-monoxide dehydrogenase large subunit